MAHRSSQLFPRKQRNPYAERGQSETTEANTLTQQVVPEGRKRDFLLFFSGMLGVTKV